MYAQEEVDEEISLSFIYSAIRKGRVKVNAKKVKPGYIVAFHDELTIDEILLGKHQRQIGKTEESIASFKKHNGIQVKNEERKYQRTFTVLVQNQHLLIINKKLGISTHGVNSIDEKIKKCFEGRESLSFSVGALHRLDKNTTGILTFSQSLKGAREFCQAMKAGRIDRYYLGINEGKVMSGIWQIGNKTYNHSIDKNVKLQDEITEVRLIEYNRGENLSLVLYKLLTGKKHQIRRGASHFEVPLFCDAKYGSKRKDYSAYFLHSFALQFRVDSGTAKHDIFTSFKNSVIAPIPNRFVNLLKKMFPKTKDILEKRGEKLFLKDILSG